MALRGGCAKSDITPPLGTTMDGYAARVGRSAGIHDKLNARAIVFDDGTHEVALVTCDLCWFTKSTVEEVQVKAKSIGVEKVLLFATHNHSGPAMTDFLASPTVEGVAYIRGLPSRIHDTIKAARDRMQPCSLSIGRTASKIGINRRDKSAETDDELTTLMLKDEEGKALGGAVSYACHPTVLGEDNLLISSEFPGCTARLVEEANGDGFVCLFINGACGDVNPRTCKGYECHGTFEDVLEIAQELAKASAATEHFDRLPDPIKVRLASVVLGPFKPYGMEVRVDSVALGDVVFLAFPGEIFASTGLWLKRHAPTRNLILGGYANGYLGYIPTKDAFQKKQDEAVWVCWVDKEAEKELRKRTLQLVDRVQG